MIGRKNWLFSGIPKGVDAAAGIYRLIEEARAAATGPHCCMKTLFTELPKATITADFLNLLTKSISLDRAVLQVSPTLSAPMEGDTELDLKRPQSHGQRRGIPSHLGGCAPRGPLGLPVDCFTRTGATLVSVCNGEAFSAAQRKPTRRPFFSPLLYAIDR